jgi:hypothetical protein
MTKVTLVSRIVHAPRCTLRQLEAALLDVDPEVRLNTYSGGDRQLVAWLYWDTCTVVGVDPLIAVAQLVHETANLTSWWSQRPRRNPAGIGVTGANDPKTGEPLGVHFPGWSWAVRAHVGRLLAYAGPGGAHTQALRLGVWLREEAIVWRPLPEAKFGAGSTVGTLAKAGWATDPDYAHKLVTVANRIAGR